MPECWKCGRPDPDLAHAVYEYVAAVLATRLWNAVDAHLNGCYVCQCAGSAYCPEGTALFELAPGDVVVLG